MINIRKSADRGHADHGWLNSYHTFSFADYYDPNFMGFRSLRVINEDWISGGQGFGTHPHRDMEIITYVLEGALAHKDSMGNGSKILPGDVQYMSAGKGVTHSEFNASETETTHLLQIWIMPHTNRLEPQYNQRNFSQNTGERILLISGDGRDDSIAIRQDADLYLLRPKPNQAISHVIKPDRHAWIQVTKGSASVNGLELSQGDGAAVSEEEKLEIGTVASGAELLLFDLI